ncbi:D19L4 mannosyltransferase, partial [Polypterus senegalus]
MRKEIQKYLWSDKNLNSLSDLEVLANYVGERTEALPGQELCKGLLKNQQSSQSRKVVDNVCWEIYQIYAMRSAEDVYKILTSYKVDYVIIEEAVCSEMGTARGCRVKDLLDFANGHTVIEMILQLSFDVCLMSGISRIIAVSEHSVILCLSLFAFVKSALGENVLYGYVEESSPPESEVVGAFAPVRGVCPGVPLESALTLDLEGDAAPYFSLLYDEERGKIFLKTAKPLYRKPQSAYTVNARVTSKTCNQTLLVNVRVLSKYARTPLFIADRLTIEVDELLPIGSELARLQAHAGQNATLVYYASPENPLLFVVPKTGQIILVGSLLDSKYINLTVFAKCTGHHELRSDPALIQIHVEKYNSSERIPNKRSSRMVIDDVFYTVNISGDAKIGDLIFTVPGLEFASMTFEVNSEDDFPVHIEIDTGRIYLAKTLKGSSEVVVKVHDLQGKKWHFCHLSLIVPELSNLEWTMYPFPYLAAVSLNATKGTAIYHLSVRHRGNGGFTSTMEYFLIEGGSGLFEVDRVTGEIRTTGKTLVLHTEHILTVQAVEELGRQSLHASVSILVGSRPPQFTNSSYTVFISENTASGKV